MPVRAVLCLAGVAVLTFAWLGPLPEAVRQSFTAHMLLHMTVVGLGVPLVAAGTLPKRPAAAGQSLTVAASLIDLVVVWVWHAPHLHHASRSNGAVLALEQASFAAAAFLLWRTALMAPPFAGAVAMFMTAMHMTLLGALLGLAPRMLYMGHGSGGGGHGADLADQQLGAVLMMALGSVIYLGAAMALSGRALRAPSRP
jgi:putative membrane protein